MNAEYIKAGRLLRFFARKFSPEIQNKMLEAGVERSAGWNPVDKIDGILKDKKLPFKTRAKVGLAWGIYAVAADSPMLFFVGIGSMILLTFQTLASIF